MTQKEREYLSDIKQSGASKLEIQKLQQLFTNDQEKDNEQDKTIIR